MGLTLKQKTLTVNGSGDLSTSITGTGKVRAIGLALGTLSTPDLTITDTLTGAAIYARAGIAASFRHHPLAKAQSVVGVDLAAAEGPPVLQDVYVSPHVLRGLTVVVAGGGAGTTGTLYVLIES